MCARVRIVKILFCLTLVILFYIFSNTESGVSATKQQKQTEPTAEGIEFFEKKIQPILADNCYSCHSSKSKKVQSNLLLDSIEGMLKGGASGQPAIIPGDPDNSTLIKAIRYTDSKLQMPMGEKLPDDVIKNFELWVKMGAPAPKSTSPNSTTSTATNQPYDWEKWKKFWAFQPITNPRPPLVKNKAWVKNPIDQFILVQLESKGLKPINDADKRTLIRRATYDLTGLPPAPDEVDKFINDKSAKAYEKLIDRLLASPVYGEKWGRHWLDVVRYADTAGDNSDYPVPAAWRYRNYVIDSFNRDKPFDQFIREQLAGDLLKPVNDEEKKSHIIATGYLAMSRRFGSRNESMNLTIDDTIDNLGKAFLGLSTACARCHDHKFDPIPTKDYYSLYGIFNSSRYSFPGAEIYPNPSNYVALVSGEKADKFYERQKELADIDDKIERLKTEINLARRKKREQEMQTVGDKPQSPADQNAKSATEPPKFKTFTSIDISADYNRDSENNRASRSAVRELAEVEKDQKKTEARFAELRSKPFNIEKAYAVVEGLPRNAKIHRKGDQYNLGDEAQRGFLSILGGAKIPDDYKGSGREYLAKWITDTNNPLTARVMVNRIWQYHFGKGIVQTPNDFGSRGTTPTHPELLDWMASKFMTDGWSIKKMHKLIMMSHAYQLSSVTETTGYKKIFEKNSSIDVSNNYLWRFNRRRLQAEELRDSILFVGGELDTTPGKEHPFPTENTWHFTQHVQFFAVYDTNKRSVYAMQQRLKKHPFFELFDGADQSAITDKRAESVTPVQALFFMNNSWLFKQADNFAIRVYLAQNSYQNRLNYAFKLAYGRVPNQVEVQEATEYISQAKKKLSAANVSADNQNRQAWAGYLRILLSSDEFLYID